MNVSLTTELEKFIARKVASGRYQTASEVVREGLRLLEQRDQKAQFQVSSLEELKEKIREGVDALERGEGIEINSKKELRAFFEDIKKRGREGLSKIDAQAKS